MGKLFKLVSGLAVTGGALAALTYHLQKKGIVNIEVNYDDDEGNSVTKPIDQIIDENVDKLKNKAGGVAQDIRQSAKEQFDNLSSQFRQAKGDGCGECGCDAAQDEEPLDETCGCGCDVQDEPACSCGEAGEGPAQEPDDAQDFRETESDEPEL